MKKTIKSISVLVLSLALAVSGLTFVQTAKADQTSEWKANAVKTPTEGSLVGAGYIDVEFDNSLPGYTYEVFLDDNPVYWKDGNILRPELNEDTSAGVRKTFTSSDTPKTEVYTTTVSAHQIHVKATKANNPTIISDPVTFYVSKKGLAMGDNMGTKASLKDLNCSWYYNWGTRAFNNSVDNGVQHIPMMWGGYDDSKQDMQNLSTTANYILGFNEPDIDSQANMGFWDGVDVWNDYIKPLKMRKVSPAPAAPFGDSGWLDDFMNGEYICLNNFLNDGSWGLYSDYGDEGSKTLKAGVGSDVDAVCLHFYRNVIDTEGLIKAVNRLWNYYKKPVWVTEIGLFGVKGLSSDMSYELENKRAEIQTHLSDVVNQLDQLPYVERYCWFAYDVDSTNEIDIYNGSGATSMFEYATGLYTDLGRMYSSIGNPVGYNAVDISSRPGFDWNNRVRTDIEYNDTTEKVKVSWSTGALDNVSKVEVSIDGTSYNVSNGDQIDTSSLGEGEHTVKFVLYNGSEIIIEKARAFEIDRSNVVTIASTTEKPTTEPATNQITTKTQKKTVNKPAKVVLKKAQNKKKKSVVLAWNKVNGATKYKVQSALNKKFTKKLKTSYTTALTIKVKKLKKKKTYYFRVAAMNSAGVGAWSNVKKVKIKK